ncbi:Tyrosine--tRNA ligase, cytoplasmic, partial [Coemansia erecta]
PRKLRGVASQGMLLAASSMENAMPKVEVLEAPEGSCPGDRVTARLGSQDGKDTPNRGGL